jgi:hypothetical protein
MVLQNEETIQRDLSRIFVRRVLDKSIALDVMFEFGNTLSGSLQLLRGAAHSVYVMDTTAENGGDSVIKFG